VYQFVLDDILQPAMLAQPRAAAAARAT